MRRLLAVAMLATLALSAAAEGWSYSTRYIKEHFLYAKGDEVNVIDLDLEWPEFIDQSTVSTLQVYLSETLFQSAAPTLDTALQTFLSRFGTPVTQQFDTIPDDTKFCYVRCELRMMAHVPNRYLSFRAAYTCCPERNSSQQADTLAALFTYNLAKEQVMQIDDLLKTSTLQTYADIDMLGRMLRYSDTPLPDNVAEMQLTAACLTPQAVVFDAIFYAEHEIGAFSTRLPMEELTRFFSKSTREMLNKKPPQKPARVSNEDSVRGLTLVCEIPDKEPEYSGGAAAMAAFIANNLQWPETNAALEGDGKLMVSMVIDTEGWPQDIRVVRPCRPELDREAVRVIRLMPGMTPGERDGRKVNCRMLLPVRFKMQ